MNVLSSDGVVEDDKRIHDRWKHAGNIIGKNLDFHSEESFLIRSEAEKLLFSSNRNKSSQR